MCGIIGEVRSRGVVDEEGFAARLKTLTARGPDGSGIKTLDQSRVFLGHRRLSIIDLSDAGTQPMSNEKDSCWLTFNGEIYNYRDLRRQLREAGHYFKSESDSEVILHGYEEWGDEVTQRLQGIFAFGIWDQRQRRLLLARDHIGVKPLYYALDGQRLLFGSQPRALINHGGITPEIDPSGFHSYLAYGYVPHAESIFASIKKLPPAHRLVWQNGTVDTRRFWFPPTEPTIFDEVEATERVRDCLVDVVRSQLVSDVSVGLYVSGGLDSSTIAAVANRQRKKPLHSFTIGFDEAESDERPFARQLVRHLGISHTEATLTYDHAVELIPEIIESYDEPFFGGSAFPTYLISNLARRHCCKVILAGDGGDELFAGYLRYDRYAKPGFAALLLQSAKRGLRSRDDVEPVRRYFDLPTMGVLKDWDRRAILGSKVQSCLADMRHDPLNALNRFYRDDVTPIRAARLMDLQVYLPDHILCKVDRASMANGVEVRVPLLDTRLVELSFQIDESIIYKHGQRKALLKSAVAPWLPDSVLSPRKKGFSIPLANWMTKAWGETAAKTVLSGSLVQRGWLDRQAVSALLDGPGKHYRWSLLALELWARRWLENESSFGNMADLFVADSL